MFSAYKNLFRKVVVKKYLFKNAVASAAIYIYIEQSCEDRKITLAAIVSSNVSP